MRPVVEAELPTPTRNEPLACSKCRTGITERVTSRQNIEIWVELND